MEQRRESNAEGRMCRINGWARSFWRGGAGCGDPVGSDAAAERTQMSSSNISLFKALSECTNDSNK